MSAQLYLFRAPGRPTDMAVWFAARAAGWDPAPWCRTDPVLPSPGWREAAEAFLAARSS